MVAGILERWRADAWFQEAVGWIAEAVSSVGAVVTGSPRVVHVRFWSVVLEVSTDHGVMWFKECHPGQGFEPELLAVLADLEPRHFPRPIAVDELTHRMLLPDLGAGRSGGGGGDWSRTLVEMAEVQQRLSLHHGILAAAGLPTLLPDDAPSYVDTLARRLTALPPTHAQHLAGETADQIESRLGHVEDWAGRLAASGVPSTFQHNDASPANTFGPAASAPQWIDVGDAFWSHPFAVLQVPVSMLTGSWPWGPDWRDEHARTIVDPYLAAWGDHACLDSMRELLEPARRLGILQRCESWRRLIVHDGELPDDPSLPNLGEHLLVATGIEAPDRR